MAGIMQIKIEQLKVTSPFIKIGAKVLNHVKATSLEDLKKYFNEAPNVGVKVGGLCIAALSPGKFNQQPKYERCRLIHIDDDKMATVWFLDCNYQGVVHCKQLRILYDSYLQDLSPFCKEFILGEIKMVPSSTYKEKVLVLHDLLIGKTFDAKILKKADAGRFVDLVFPDGSSLRKTIANHSILKTLFKPIPLELQIIRMAEEKGSAKQVCSLQTLVELPPLHSSRATVVELSKVSFSVRIADYSKSYGPQKFFVHFTDNDDEFQRFQFDLQKHKKNLKPMNCVPAKGQSCLALIKDQLYRAEAKRSADTNVKSQVMVLLLEKGSEVSVDVKQLYHIPGELVDVQPFAKKCRLADFEPNSIPHLQQNEIDFYFHHITKQKLLTLKIIDASSVPTCQLFNGNVNILDLIKRWNPHKLRYQDQLELTQGVYKAKITSVESPKAFYVQLGNPKEKAKLQNLTDNLRIVDAPKLRNPQINDACIVQLNISNMRGRIVKKATSEVYKVLFIDLGFCDDIHVNEIKVSVEEFMKPPPFAFKCCLKGFEDIENVRPDTIAEFEEIAKFADRFQMLVKYKLRDSYVVEMEDMRDGNLVGNALNKSDWTLPPTPAKSHFDKRRVNHSNIMDYSHVSHANESDTELLICTECAPDLSASEKATGATSRSFKTQEEEGSIWSGSNSKSGDGCETSSATSSGISSSLSGLVKTDVGRVTAVVSPTDFTIQNTSSIKEYEAFVEELQELAMAQGPLTIFSVGSFCLACRPFDQKWCRAIITDVDLEDFLVTLRCTDDGSTFSVQNKSHLKASSIQLVFKLYFGLNCSLPMRCHPKTEKVAADVLMQMKNQDVAYRMISEYGGKKLVELYHKSKDVTAHLIQMGCGKRLAYVPNGKAHIILANSMTDFYVQMDSEKALLDSVTYYLKSYLQVKVKKPEVGMIIIARAADDFWYRAMILDINNKSTRNVQYEVNFIDIGTIATTVEVGIIENPNIKDIHPLAYKCSVVLPRGLAYADLISGNKKLNEWADSGPVNIKLIKPHDEYAEVDVLSCDEEPPINFLSEIMSLNPTNGKSSSGSSCKSSEEWCP